MIGFTPHSHNVQLVGGNTGTLTFSHLYNKSEAVINRYRVGQGGGGKLDGESEDSG